MMIARWHIQARFGHKQAALELMKRWSLEIGAKAGIKHDSHRIITGSVGALESEIQTEMTIVDLADLERIFTNLGKVPGHAEFAAELENVIVSGTNYWEVFRVIQ